MSKLNKEEKDILKSYEKGEWTQTKDFKNEKNKYRAIARATIQKKKYIRIQLSTHDIEGLRLRALDAGIPYQALVTSLLHKYISGSLTEK